MKGPIERINKKISVPLAYRLKDNPYVTPNRITILSFLIAGVTAPLAILKGHLWIAAVLIYIGALLDSLDGDLARVRGEISKEGAILDAVLDRYIDLFLISALILYDKSCLTMGLLAMIGSALVPYIRARMEASGKKSTATIGSRDVRNLILFIGLLLLGPCLTLTLLALVSNVSALHRLLHAIRSRL